MLRQQLNFEKRNSRQASAPAQPSHDKHNTFAMERDNQELMNEVDELRQLVDEKSREIERLSLKIRGL